jgi:tRNA-uridine 2-sulfurtransferase
MKAIAIISGGLDSSLAIKAIQLQNIEVIAVHFLIPFVMNTKESIHEAAAKKITEHLNCEFKLVVLDEAYLEMFRNPNHGYGGNLNPCIDCKILMLKHAKKIMQESGASFVVTGEVLGQRPMSQNKQALAAIEKESGLDGLLLRPLSAKLLPETIPQREGWLKEEYLFDFSGRSRKPQIGLAANWGITDYPWPAGGCLLTDPHFCIRLADLIKYDECTRENIELLKLGRHFRINDKTKLILGRNSQENEKLLRLIKDGDITFEPNSLPGPTAILRGNITQGDKDSACRLIARYTSKDKPVEVKMSGLGLLDEEIIIAEPYIEEEIQKIRI